MHRLLACKIIHPIYKKKLSKIILQLIPNNSFILDVGSGKGCVSKYLKQYNKTLKPICLDIKKTNVDVNGSAVYLPFKDKSFDITIVIDVLHHTTQIITILKELKRVTKNHIIIKEQAFTSVISKLMILFGDELTNKHAIYNHLHYCTWKEIFKELDLTVVTEPKNLDFGLCLSEKMNQVWKLKS